MAVLHITDLTTNMAKECKNENIKIISRKVDKEQKTRYEGSRIYTICTLHPWDASSEKNFHTPKVYLTVSKCV